ncbi:hypothetical protein F1728_15345 [Gimesia benthica]|uniref:Uncharacterized protein n=1 Tax=Gimesia benthica TaxID=2608982 RepID=A0A6I6AED1_9PLAN|nr:hypothetical protein [Gimesia benthica]QGQ23972.1 hypothetical protein F1728_15345 [Gimesia benthica]
MNERFDPRIIKDLPPGFGIFVPTKVGEDNMRKFCWMIRMESSKIKEIEQLPIGSVIFHPKLCYHSILVNEHRVGVFNVLIGMSPDGVFNQNTIYEAFCNEFDETTSGVISTFTTQKVVPILLIGDSREIEHSLAFENTVEMKRYAQKVLALLSTHDYEWTQDEFEICKQDYISRYPTRMERWNNC